MNGLWLALVALLVLAVGMVLLLVARRRRVDTGLPSGRVVYGDTADWNRVDEPLISRRYGLVGKPDYLVEQRVGRQRHIIPVEVKSRPRPVTPYAGHILQLGVYCLLVEDQYKRRPPHGLLHYADATLEIPFDDGLRRQVLDAAADLRAARRAADVHRHHDDPARCAGCGYRQACGEALV